MGQIFDPFSEYPNFNITIWQSLSILSYFIQPMHRHSYGTETVKFETSTIMIIFLFFSGDLLQRFGGLLVQFHPSLLEALSPQLKSPRLAVRKRSIIALGHLVSLKKLLQFIYSEKATKTSQILNFYLNLLSNVKRSLKVYSYFCGLYYIACLNQFYT